MSRYQELAGQIVKEHEKVLLDVPDRDVDRFLDEICKAKCIQVYGMGRMCMAEKGFVMRLMHMGFDAHEVYSTTCPNIGPGDLLIANGACTEVYSIIMRLAKKAGAKVCAITPHPDGEWGKLADFVVRLRGQMSPGAPDGEIPSIQPMGALFEQTMLVFEDIVIQLLMEKCGITAEQMAKKHTNLDGYMSMD